MVNDYSGRPGIQKVQLAPPGYQTYHPLRVGTVERYQSLPGAFQDW
jgi:hypothetical protein